MNTICALVAELAWALLRSQPHLLCLHCAAIELEGRLVVFPSGRRSGKSFLTALLAAAGHRVFTDDFLPLECDERKQVQGIACGVSPRLRAPFPPNIDAKTASWIAGNAGPANGQYNYLELPDATLARHGARLPIGAIVLLDRREGEPVSLKKAPDADILRTLIVQNFGRAARSDRILMTLSLLLARSVKLVLTYSNAADIPAVLAAESSTWPDPTEETSIDCDMNPSPARPFDMAADYDPSVPYVQSVGVTEVAAEDSSFLTDPNGIALHQLSAVSAGIWRMLARPMREAEITSILAAAFPDQVSDNIEQDVRNLLTRLAGASLIAQHHTPRDW